MSNQLFVPPLTFRQFLPFPAMNQAFDQVEVEVKAKAEAKIKARGWRVEGKG